MYTLYSGVNYQDGNSKNLPEIDGENISDIGMAIVKIMSDHEDLIPVTFTFSVAVKRDIDTE